MDEQKMQMWELNGHIKKVWRDGSHRRHMYFIRIRAVANLIIL